MCWTGDIEKFFFSQNSISFLPNDTLICFYKHVKKLPKYYMYFRRYSHFKKPCRPEKSEKSPFLLIKFSLNSIFFQTWTIPTEIF